MLPIMLCSKKQAREMMVALGEHAEEASQPMELVRINYQLFMICGASKNMKLQLHGYLYTVTDNVSILICRKLGPSCYGIEMICRLINKMLSYQHKKLPKPRT